MNLLIIAFIFVNSSSMILICDSIVAVSVVSPCFLYFMGHSPIGEGIWQVRPVNTNSTPQNNQTEKYGNGR